MHGQFYGNVYNVLYMTLSELSGMALIHVMTFVVLEISYNLVSIDVSQIWKSSSGNVTFIFGVILESDISFD